MKLNLTNMINARRWTLLMSVLLLSVITACGGGNGSAGAKLGSGTGGTGTGTAPTTNGVISLKFTSAANTVTNVIPVTGYLTATANVVDAAGNPVVGTVVTFTASNAAAVISPSLGTAITDKSGNAFVTVQPGTASGAGVLTASATAVGTTVITANGAYTLNAIGTTALPTLTLALSSCDNNNLSSACPLQVTATFKDGTGAVIPNQLVTFSAT